MLRVRFLFFFIIFITPLLHSKPVGFTKLVSSDGEKHVVLFSDNHLSDGALAGATRKILQQYNDWMNSCLHAFTKSGQCNVIVEALNYKLSYNTSEKLQQDSDLQHCLYSAGTSIRNFLNVFRVLHDNPTLLPKGTLLTNMETKLRILVNEVTRAMHLPNQQCLHTFNDLFCSAQELVTILSNHNFACKYVNDLQKGVLDLRSALNNYGLQEHQIKTVPIVTLYRQGDKKLVQFLHSEFLDKKKRTGLTESFLWKSILRSVDVTTIQTILDDQKQKTTFIFAGSEHIFFITFMLRQMGFSVVKQVDNATMSVDQMIHCM